MVVGSQTLASFRDLPPCRSWAGALGQLTVQLGVLNAASLHLVPRWSGEAGPMRRVTSVISLFTEGIVLDSPWAVMVLGGFFAKPGIKYFETHPIL